MWADVPLNHIKIKHNVLNMAANLHNHTQLNETLEWNLHCELWQLWQDMWVKPYTYENILGSSNPATYLHIHIVSAAMHNYKYA